MRNQYKYKIVDAFTSAGSLGNPAACLYLTPSQILSNQEMLDIAKQHKGFASEVIYCLHDDTNIHLTYFSSECEVDFCGHGTIACMHSLIKDNPGLLLQKEICIKTNRKGTLTVYNKIPEQEAVFITAPKPSFIGIELSVSSVAEKLEVPKDAIHSELPIELIDAGLRTLIVPLRDLETEISIFPNEQELKIFCIENNIDIVLVYSQQVKEPGYIAHTRVFAPRFGYLEDPATGSGNSAFGYYMLKNKLWDGDFCRIEQGGNNRVFNCIQLSYANDAILFGGSSTIRIDGIFYARS